MPDRPSIVRTVLARLLIAAALVVAGVGLLAHQRMGVVSNTWNPFAPLDVQDRPNWLTGYKLGRLERDASECRAVLAASSLVSSPVPDEETGQGCGFTDAVEVERSSIRFNRSFRATCPLAVSWALFEQHVLQPAARQYLNQSLTRVEHLGTYSCRNLYHREGGRRSEHATANAIDIAGFVLADGTQVSVLTDWNGSAAKASFLRAVRDGACRFFEVVLSPDYNEAHKDHFHLDRGRGGACR
ncbi:MAG TPA: extensin family protein [Microvirga sp.]|jgi:hypothetical protein